MSKSRNEMQKARRAYLDKCKKDGVKPVSVEKFNVEYQKKILQGHKKPIAKPVKKGSKKRAPVEHCFYDGDTVIFKDFTPEKMVRFALKIMFAAVQNHTK